MPYALRSTVNSADLEIAEILLSLKNGKTIRIEDDSSEYIPDEESVDDDLDSIVDEESETDEAEDATDEDYIPEDADEADDEDYVPDEADDDEDYVPDEADDDEDYVPEDEDDDATDEDYVPEADEALESVIRQACSSLAKGQELPREFWRVLVLTHKNQVPAHFKRWMLGIPPVKSIYTHFSKRR